MFGGRENKEKTNVNIDIPEFIIVLFLLKTEVNDLLYFVPVPLLTLQREVNCGLINIFLVIGCSFSFATMRTYSQIY